MAEKQGHREEDPGQEARGQEAGRAGKKPSREEAGGREGRLRRSRPAEEARGRQVRGREEAGGEEARREAEGRSAEPAKAERRERPVVKARARYVRVAPRKARLIADQVRGLPLEDARTLLRFSSRGAARDIAKLIDSAAANAENNHDLVADDL